MKIYLCKTTSSVLSKFTKLTDLEGIEHYPCDINAEDIIIANVLPSRKLRGTVIVDEEIFENDNIAKAVKNIYPGLFE